MDVLEAGVADLAWRPGAQELYFLKPKEKAVVRLDLKTQQRATISCAAFPAGEVSSLRVRADGHLYFYAGGERVVYHLDPAGQLLDKFGSGGDIRCGIPAGCIGPCFDVDENGNEIK